MQSSFEPSPDLGQELEGAWTVSDRLFSLCGEARLESPIPFRHPFLFYLGHLPAFAWNQLGRGALGEPPINAAFEELFERGIDPGVAGGAPPRVDEAAWPNVDRVLHHVVRVRAALRE